MNMFLAAGFVLVFCLNVGVVEGCMCLPRHPQASFCSADFALKGMVIKKYTKKDMTNAAMFEMLGLEVPVNAYYDILVMKVYKGNVTAKEDTYASFFKATIQTSAHQATCGTEFDKGKSYLFTGRIFNGELQVNKCDWTKEYKTLTPSMKRGIKGEYQCNKCKINTCMNGHCDNESKCKWEINYNQPIDECTAQHRICKVNKEGECGWNNGLFYQACSNKIILDLYKPS
ncbi:metalloproteinase inhibitor 3-like [Clytia hemisphaerica]|uniref:NTR domain-containing protein n=1 Tax=Clytia hemisphaerica TaxID=252671 RepID=A0A7M5TWY3_9CNID